jgi:5,5'-dehydrodivanillate O-demethylase oxygenase subunit
MAKVRSADFVHTGPGTLAGKYLRAFWQPVYRAEDLCSERAVSVRVMSEDFTLYRSEGGRSHLVAFRCAHRGTQLAVGWVEGDCIRCRYHGWKYDASGQCVEQPDEAKPFSHKVKIKSYPTIEYLGLIFAFLGDGEPPPVRRFADFEGDGVLKVGPPEAWPCNFFNRCENTMDTSHVNWTHRATRERLQLDKQILRRVPESVEETNSGIQHIMRFVDGRAERIDFYMPNVSHVRPRGRVEGTDDDAATIAPHRLFFYVPIDDEHSNTFVVDYISLTGDAAQAYLRRAAQDRTRGTITANEMGAAILAGTMQFSDIGPEMSSYYSFWVEDYVTLVGQGAIPDRQSERLGPNDMGPILLRKIWDRELKALASGEPLKQWL